MMSCVKDETEGPVVIAGTEYFPLEVGRYVEYAVDSIVFDDAPGGNTFDTTSFFLREEIASREIRSVGDTIYYLNRFRKDQPLEQWRLTDVWTTGKNGFEAWRTEENLTFRKMTFPLRDNRRWVATSYIPPQIKVLIGTELVQAYQQWDARVVEIDIADSVGQFSFDNGSVLHVSQTDTDDGSTRRYSFEKYVRDVGLVFRSDTILDSRCLALGDFTPCLGRPWMQHAAKGYILHQIITSHN